MGYLKEYKAELRQALKIVLRSREFDHLNWSLKEDVCSELAEYCAEISEAEEAEEE